MAVMGSSWGAGETPNSGESDILESVESTAESGNFSLGSLPVRGNNTRVN
jgi:hypothetical protein